MPEIKNQIKESIQFVLDRTFENDEPCYFSLAKDINEIIFEYFKLYEEEKFKIENENLECRLNKNCDNISPFDPDFKSEELNNDSIESLENLEDYKIVVFEFENIDGVFKYYTYLSVFKELLKDENLKIRRNYHSINITDIHPVLKDLDFSFIDYYNKLEISNKYYTANVFGILVEEFKTKHQMNPKVFSLSDDEVDKIFIEETTNVEVQPHPSAVEVIPTEVVEVQPYTKKDIFSGIPKAIEVHFEEVLLPAKKTLSDTLEELPSAIGYDRPVVEPLDLDEVEVEKEEKEETPLTEHQSEVVNGLLTKISEIMANSMIMTNTPAGRMALFEGAAGTGKTFTMSYVLKTLSKKYKLAMCSPTHEALSVIRQTLTTAGINFAESPDEYGYGGNNIIIKTIASYLNIKMQRDLENGTESFEEDRKGVTLNCDILCIDECSMISKELIQMMIKKLGIQFKMVLFIGDEPQLPSPSDGEEGNGLFQLPFKYSLTQVVRQKEGSSLLNVAWWIRSFILAKNTVYVPSQLLTEQLHNNFDIFLTRDQNEFINSYLNNTSTSKYIGTYTNNLTDEYNLYIRNLAVMGYQNLNYEVYPFRLSLDTIDETDIEKSNRTYITQDPSEYQEFFVGEYLKAAEINQRNNKVYHQNGDIFRIQDLTLREHIVTIETPGTGLYEQASRQEYSLKYWCITDTDGKIVNVVRREDQLLHKELISKLYQEAQRATGKRRFYKYMSFKEKFTKVNYLFASTLHKLQGKTCEDLYLDVRDLDKYYRNQPLTVYKLIYVALTRPTSRIHILI